MPFELKKIIHCILHMIIIKVQTFKYIGFIQMLKIKYVGISFCTQRVHKGDENIKSGLNRLCGQ